MVHCMDGLLRGHSTVVQARRWIPVLLTTCGLAGVASAASVASAEDAIVVKPANAVAALAGKDGRVDHAAWSKLLAKYVDAEGLVDYKRWKAQDQPALDRYLQGLTKVDPAKLADKPERIAFWINAYNALTIKGMLKFHPTPSIKKHTSVLWGFHFWDDVRITVAGKERSLDHIEHAILRKMDEPRMHFAIVCASIGCPRLRRAAYTGPQLEKQLAAGAREFFASRSYFQIDAGSTTVKASHILKWFREDFGGTDANIFAFARRWTTDPARLALLARPGLTLEFLEYDWGINEQKRKK
jgi:hypothetical protein